VLPSRGRIVARNGSLHIDNAEQATVVIFATVSASALSQHTQQPVLHFFRSLPAYPQATILPTGIALFAEDAAGRMRREISLISTCTMVVLGLLFWWVFRSWRAVLLVMGSVAVSCFGAVVVTALLWESWLGSALHLMTVGFGSSLLGVSSDYAVHYLVTQRSFNTTKGWEPLRKILPGLLLGFITSVVGFLGIACSPFPGLQQLALFSYVGLSLSLLLVITIFPALARGAPYDNRLTRLAAGARQLLSRRARIFLLGVVCVPVVYGLTRVQVVDDIRALDTPSEQVVRNQREGAALLGVGHGGALLIVRGATAEETLQREEQAREILDGLVRAGKIDGYHAVSRNIPSQRRQAERYRRFGVLLRQAPQQLAEFSADLHLPEASQSALHALLQGDTARLLTLAECLESGACDAVRDLVVSESSGAVATVVPLLVPPGTAVQEIFESFEGSAGRTAEGSSLPTPRSDLGSPLSGAGRDGALGVWDLHISGSHLVSQAEAISGALRLYRRSATWGALVFYGVIFLLLALRYGVWGAGRAFVPPLCGGLAALGALGVAGVPLNVFAVFALMVLLGVSVDYAIFFAEDDTEGDSADATGFSVVLSATTTAISFGLLALSSSPALRGFGVVLAVGVVVAALLAPLARRQPQASTAGSGGL
jgi:predicted exporter